MGLVIYRKSDSKVMLEVIQYPLFDTEVFERFISEGGHKAENFAKLEIPQNDISKAMRSEIIIQNGKITFGNDRPALPTETPGTPPTTETPNLPFEIRLKEQEIIIAELKQQNAALRDDQLFMFEENQKAAERASAMQDDILFIYENFGG